MSKSGIEEKLPTLVPLARRIRSNTTTGVGAVGRGIRWFVKRTWKPALVLLLVLAAVHTAATFVLGRRVADEIAKIKAKGEPVSLVEAAPPPVPDAENAALVYAKAFALLPERSYIENASGISSESNAYKVLLDPEKRAEDPSLWDRAGTEVAASTAVIRLAEQAQSMPKCRFDVNWEDGFAAIFPHYNKLRQTARFLGTDAMLRARKGDPAGAIGSLEKLFALQESVKHEPGAIGVLVRAAMVETGRDALLQVMQMGPVHESDARRLAEQLAEISAAEDFPRAMLGERATVIQTFDVLRTSNPFEDHHDHWMYHLYFSYVGRPYIHWSELRMLRFWVESIRLSKRPYREISKDDWAKLESLVNETGLLGILCPVFSRAHAAAEAADAKLVGSRIALALNVYKQRHSSYPQTLSQLRSSVRWVPTDRDVFSGKDFVYHSDGDGYVLYSIGPNLKDDGGVSVPKPKPGEMPRDPNAYDIVWKMER